MNDLPPDPTVLNAIDAECANHVAHGFDAAHDDTHTDASILRCAEYIVGDVLRNAQTTIPHEERIYLLVTSGSDLWPADRAEHIRQKYADDTEHRLVIAASLIVKEIYRRRRASLK